MTLTLLDAFCGEGGATAGYERAGYEVTGVDIKAMPKYCGDRFIKGDAIEYIREHGSEYDLIHASPPCQHASAGTRAMRAQGDTRHPALIEPTRAALEASGRPYVIENVKGAALRWPITLCGTMFDLTTEDDDGTLLYLQRHRLFESNMPLAAPPHDHPTGVQWAGSYGGARRNKHDARHIRHGGYVPSTAVQRKLLGIEWMSQQGLFQSLPPIYCEYLGVLIRQQLEIAA